MIRLQQRRRFESYCTNTSMQLTAGVVLLWVGEVATHSEARTGPSYADMCGNAIEVLLKHGGLGAVPCIAEPSTPLQ